LQATSMRPMCGSISFCHSPRRHPQANWPEDSAVARDRFRRDPSESQSGQICATPRPLPHEASAGDYLIVY
jgi:hypothetical protein